jgi:hypothetical protein
MTDIFSRIYDYLSDANQIVTVERFLLGIDELKESINTLPKGEELKKVIEKKEKDIISKEEILVGLYRLLD